MTHYQRHHLIRQVLLEILHNVAQLSLWFLKANKMGLIKFSNPTNFGRIIKTIKRLKTNHRESLVLHFTLIIYLFVTMRHTRQLHKLYFEQSFTDMTFIYSYIQSKYF